MAKMIKVEEKPVFAEEDAKALEDTPPAAGALNCTSCARAMGDGSFVAPVFVEDTALCPSCFYAQGARGIPGKVTVCGACNIESYAPSLAVMPACPQCSSRYVTVLRG